MVQRGQEMNKREGKVEGGELRCGEVGTTSSSIGR